ncbi:hypothetical protein NQ315_008961 [Exocentrus adspersus]|uniref:Uncharacterized protein n=1 Tax=Exocentrus adspersus TaxID=1586481 RepID=A0AAV8VIL1_9CUCU|nr:hypothetical protein NQ315_008961 [Exocentrus adspersus]
MNDVEDMGKYVIVTLRQTENLTTRRFTITDDGCSFQPCTFYRKYVNLWPPRTEHLRFFLTYRHGTDRNTFPLMLDIILLVLVKGTRALYRSLFSPNWGHYGCGCGWKYSITKTCRGWKSREIAMSYVDDSINNKIEMSKKLFPGKESTNATILYYWK